MASAVKSGKVGSLSIYTLPIHPNAKKNLRARDAALSPSRCSGAKSSLLRNCPTRGEFCNQMDEVLAKVTMKENRKKVNTSQQTEDQSRQSKQCKTLRGSPRPVREYRAFCLWKMESQSFAIKGSGCKPLLVVSAVAVSGSQIVEWFCCIPV